MNYLSSKEWIQEIVKNCLHFLSSIGCSDQPSSIDLTYLKSSYDNFSKEDLDTLHNIFLNEFEINDSILLLSYVIRILGIKDFTSDVALQIYKGNFDFFSQIMLEIQLAFFDNIDYKLKRDIHRKSITCLSHELSINFPYIPLEKRNKNRVVIITEQLLEDSSHAPTLMTLQTAYTLQQRFHYEVLIFTCASNKVLPVTLWVDTYGFNSGEYGFKKRPYNNTLLPVYQYPLDSCSLTDYTQMLTQIYDWNPMFVLNMGVNNPIADLPKSFTTLVCRDMSTTPPISEADILIRGISYNTTAEIAYKQSYSAHQTQLFMTQKFPVISYNSSATFTRKDLNLPEDKFLIAIVGNRLDTEIDNDFLKILFCLLTKTTNIDFVIIGETSHIQTCFSETPYWKRIHFLGYCNSLLSVYQTLNLYLNPKRLGGGWSSAIALQAGLPVVTFPNCDVAYNVPDKFIVSSDQNMIETIIRYSTDFIYYKQQSKYAKEFSTVNNDQKIIEYVAELLTKIKEVLPND